MKAKGVRLTEDETRMAFITANRSGRKFSMEKITVPVFDVDGKAERILFVRRHYKILDTAFPSEFPITRSLYVWEPITTVIVVEAPPERLG